MKELINLDKKFKEVYQNRVDEIINIRALKDLQDQKQAGEELQNFDEAREAHLKAFEEREQKELNKIKANNLIQKAELDKILSSLEAEMGELDAKITNIESGTESRVASLENEEANGSKQIMADKKLDLEKEQGQKVE